MGKAEKDVRTARTTAVTDAVANVTTAAVWMCRTMLKSAGNVLSV